MAIFERQITNKVCLDDTEKLICAIENAHNIDKHTEYSIRVQRGCTKENTWFISRRYNDFSCLHSALQPADVTLPLPPKRIIGNMQPGFIAERQIALQVYLDTIMKNNILASSLPVKIFLDPKNYSMAINEMALQNVSMALRGDGDFELKSSLPNIGWRVRKHYFLVSRGQGKVECHVMSWSTYGPDKTLAERDLQVAFKSLMNLEHPYIDKIIFMHSLETGAYVIRKVHSGGSVRDALYSAHYGSPSMAKYAWPKQRKPFTIGQLAHYGYQMLQALKYLHDRGLPYGHLHPGNITIENQRILLMDIENSLLGLPCYYRQFILEHKKICNMEAVDVYCFGHTLYEMAFGEPLTTSICDQFPSISSPQLVSVLQLILSTTACKRGLPSIESLLLHPFFSFTPSAINGNHPEITKNCHLKFPNQTKEHLKEVILCIETRMKSDQKLMRIERRQLRIQEILSSEEELRKRKRKSKHKENNALSNSHSSLNGFSQSGLSPLSMSGPSERSGSVASTLSTASSTTPPQITDESLRAPPMSPPPSGMDTSRSAFLESICSFNKNKLNKAKK